MNLYTPTGIGELMEEFGFSFSKKYGQNFLINEGVVEKIADAALAHSGAPKRACIEIGPGIGSLTAKLSERFDKVLSIEIDDRLIPMLEKTLSEHSNVSILHADALQVDLKSVAKSQLADHSLCVCANLPYYITSQIIMHLLENGPRFSSLVLMVQKEAAARLVSTPGKSEYGSIAAAVSYYAKTKKLFDVQPGSFLPRPKVVSTVLCLEPYEKKPVSPKNEALFLEMIRASFAQRRKTLTNSLVSYYGGRYGRDVLEEAIRQSGVDPQRRGETLGLWELCALADALADLGNQT